MKSKKKFNIDNPPNILIILTDQQRANLHLPADWQKNKLPGMTVLRNYGVEFINGFCNSCMCSPSRASFLTSLYPAQTGVTATLSFGGAYSLTETELDPSVPNLAKMLEKWYDCQYRGKWHINKGGQNDAHPEQSLVPSDLAIFGFRGWIAPDSGEDTKLENFGGGYADHDTNYAKQAVDFIKDWRQKKDNDENPRPFFMILSIVNPHDVLSYPDTYIDGGYNDDWLVEDEYDIPIPPGNREKLYKNLKPASQWQNKVTMAAAFGAINTKKKKQDYVNFYANLVALNDQKISIVLEEFYNRKKDGSFGTPKQLGNDTLIVRLSDHGEMGMAHGGLRQKTFNAYEESIRVPFIFTNPEVINGSGKPVHTEHLGSLIDIMPTLAGLLGIDPPENIRGKNLTKNIYEPAHSKARRNSVLFTYDDVRAGNPDMAEVTQAANRLRTVRTRNWKYTRYFHELGSFIEEYELYFLTGKGYDQQPGGKLSKLEKALNKLLRKHPLEFVNLAYPKNKHMKEWPQWVKDGVEEKRKEMAKLLKVKERTIITLQQAEIRKGLKKMSLTKN